jgi:hypothetical protein
MGDGQGGKGSKDGERLAPTGDGIKGTGERGRAILEGKMSCLEMAGVWAGKSW